MLSSTSPDGKSTTNGNSGGHLLLIIPQKDNSKQFIQVGIISMSVHEDFSMYVNVTNREVFDFINDTIKKIIFDNGW